MKKEVNALLRKLRAGPGQRSSVFSGVVVWDQTATKPEKLFSVNTPVGFSKIIQDDFSSTFYFSRSFFSLRLEIPASSSALSFANEACPKTPVLKTQELISRYLIQVCRWFGSLWPLFWLLESICLDASLERWIQSPGFAKANCLRHFPRLVHHRFLTYMRSSSPAYYSRCQGQVCMRSIRRESWFCLGGRDFGPCT